MSNLELEQDHEMGSRRRGALASCVLFLLMVLIHGGCASYKNPVSTKPNFSSSELSTRIGGTIRIKLPSKSEKVDRSNNYDQDYRYQMQLQESERLARILNDFQLFDSVLLDDNPAGADYIIEALPRTFERTSLDDPWLLLYAGAIPSYSKIEKGIVFRWLKGGTGEYLFKWTEEVVVGIWAPAVSGSRDTWHANRNSSQYWIRLREDLLNYFIRQGIAVKSPTSATQDSNFWKSP